MTPVQTNLRVKTTLPGQRLTGRQGTRREGEGREGEGMRRKQDTQQRPPV